MTPEDQDFEASPPRRNIFLRSGFFWVSLAVHALLITLAAFLVVQTISVKRKTSFEGAKQAPAASTRALEYKVASPSSSSSSPALAKRIAAKGASAIALPEMPRSPRRDWPRGGLGIGLGSGTGSGSGGSGGGSGIVAPKFSIFGSNTRNAGALIGYLYDLK